MNNSSDVTVKTYQNRTDTVEYHFHLHFEIIYVKEGSLSLCYYEKATEILPGELCIIPPLTPHKSTYINACVDSIAFEKNYLPHYISADAIKAVKGFGKEILFVSNSATKNIAGKLMKKTALSGDSGAYIHIFMLFMHSCQDKDFRFSNISESLVKIFDCINSHHSDKLLLENIAAKCNLTKFHICRLMKSALGITPVDYITFIKMKQAVTFLTETTYTIKRISEILSFSSPKYFTKIFKKYYAVSPAEYKKGSHLLSKEKYFLHNDNP